MIKKNPVFSGPIQEAKQYSMKVNLFNKYKTEWKAFLELKQKSYNNKKYHNYNNILGSAYIKDFGGMPIG